MEGGIKVPNKLINVLNAKGETVTVTQKAFDVFYSNQGYKIDIEPTVTEQEEAVDLFTLSTDELKKINKSDIASFLDDEGIEYTSKMTKDDLINLITGDANEEPEQDS